jgi:hypothetical protein
MSIILPRRGFLLGLAAMIAAPAIVRVENIMPVRAIVQPTTEQWWKIVDTDGGVEFRPMIHAGDVEKILNAQLVYVR